MNQFGGKVYFDKAMENRLVTTKKQLGFISFDLKSTMIVSVECQGLNAA